MNEPVTKELVIHKIKHNLRRLRTAIKWIIFSILSGLLIGMVGIAFYFGMTWVTDTRTAYPWLIFFLPLGGIVIVLLYHLLHDEKDTGTNLVLSAIHSGDEIPLRMAPLIFISTLITHLFGGSAGREGAALQLGGSIGNSLGRLFRFDEKDKHIMIMCGMSAAFSALFGTDGCRYFSAGSSQCRHHALFCISAMCYLCFSSTWSGITLSDCAAVLCHFRHSGIWNFFCSYRNDSCRFMCIGQYPVLYFLTLQ